RQVSGDTAETRVTIDASIGSDRLEQRVVRYGPGRSLPHELDGTQGIFFVVSGRAVLELEGERHDLETDCGAYFRPGESFTIENSGPDELVTVLVTTWAPEGRIAAPEPRVVHYRDRPSLPAGKDR